MIASAVLSCVSLRWSQTVNLHSVGQKYLLKSSLKSDQGRVYNKIIGTFELFSGELLDSNRDVVFSNLICSILLIE